MSYHDMAQESQKDTIREELERKISTYLLQGTLERLMAVKAKHGEAMEIIYAVSRLLSRAVPSYIHFKDTVAYYQDEREQEYYYLYISSRGLSVIRVEGSYEHELDYYPYGHDNYILSRLVQFIAEFNKHLDELITEYNANIEKYTYYP
jgi:hypothetical protein